MQVPPTEWPSCPLCAGEVFHTVIAGACDAIWNKPGRFDVQVCDACALAMTRPRPTADGLGFYYEDAYSGASKDAMKRFQAEGWFSRRIASYRSRVIARVRPLAKQDHVLDVGCSYGGFLNHVHTTVGAKCAGIDLDQGTIEDAVRPDVIAYHQGTLGDHELDGRFTVITFFESLEHTREPVLDLVRARELLEPGGLCVVEVPNFEGSWRRVFGRYWLPLLIPQHLYHFDRASLRRTVERAGLEVRHQQSMFFPLEGVASLFIWIAQTLRMRPLGAPFAWRTPFDMLVGLLMALAFPVLFVLVELPSQAVLKGLGRSGHQLLVAQKPAAPEAPQG